MVDFSDHEDSLFSEERRKKEREQEDARFTNFFVGIAFVGLLVTLALWYFKK